MTQLCCSRAVLHVHMNSWQPAEHTDQTWQYRLSLCNGEVVTACNPELLRSCSLQHSRIELRFDTCLILHPFDTQCIANETPCHSCGCFLSDSWRLQLPCFQCFRLCTCLQAANADSPQGRITQVRILSNDQQYDAFKACNSEVATLRAHQAV